MTNQSFTNRGANDPLMTEHKLDSLLKKLGFEQYDGHNWSFKGTGLGIMKEEKAALYSYITAEMQEVELGLLNNLLASWEANEDIDDFIDILKFKRDRLAELNSLKGGDV